MVVKEFGKISNSMFKPYHKYFYVLYKLFSKKKRYFYLSLGDLKMNKILILFVNNIFCSKEEIWNGIILFFNVSVRSHLRDLWTNYMHDHMYVYVDMCVWLLVSMHAILKCKCFGQYEQITVWYPSLCKFKYKWPKALWDPVQNKMFRPLGIFLYSTPLRAQRNMGRKEATFFKITLGFCIQTSGGCNRFSSFLEEMSP